MQHHRSRDHRQHLQERHNAPPECPQLLNRHVRGNIRKRDNHRDLHQLRRLEGQQVAHANPPARALAHLPDKRGQIHQNQHANKKILVKKTVNMIIDAGDDQHRENPDARKNGLPVQVKHTPAAVIVVRIDIARRIQREQPRCHQQEHHEQQRAVHALFDARHIRSRLLLVVPFMCTDCHRESLLRGALPGIPAENRSGRGS